MRIALFLVAVELTLRGYNWWIGEQSLYQSDPDIGFRVRPNLQRIFYSNSGEPYLLETNSRGYRDRQHPYRRTDGRSRVVVLGSSTPFGMGIDQSDLFPATLESLLPTTDVVNLSVPCTTLDQHFVTLREEALRYGPDVVLVFVALPDTCDSFWPWQVMTNKPKCWLKVEPDGVAIHPPRFGLPQRLMSSSHAWQSVVNLAILALILSNVNNDDMAALQPYFAGQNLSEPQRFEALRRLLVLGRDLCAREGTEFVVVYLPFPDEIQGVRCREVDLLRENVLTPAAEEDYVQLVDLSDPLKAAWREFGELMWEDEYHVNARGHHVIAEYLAEYLGAKLRGLGPPQVSDHPAGPSALSNAGN